MENKDETNKNYVIIGLLVAIIIMIVGYLRIATVARLKTKPYGTDDIWDIAITNIKMVDKTNLAIERSKPTFANKNASFDVLLPNPNDSIKYEVTVKNRGTIDAKLHSYLIVPEDDKHNIEYIFEKKDDEFLFSGLETKYYVTIKYIGLTENDQESSRTLLLEYVQKK